MDYMKVYNEWLSSSFFDEEVKEELRSIADNQKEIEDRFYRDLEFGTGGLRGVVGMGTNRMNKYTVRRATYGLAQYILEKDERAAERGVVIAHDNRNMSREFTLESALTLAACGIKTYIFDDLRPTPQLSFTVRNVSAAAGIVITASHNPPEYNGYKAYGEDGAQLNVEESELVIEKVNAITDYSSIPVMDEEKALEKGLIKIFGYKADEDFINAVRKQSLCEDIVRKVADDLKIVFTPLHGTGNMPVRRILKEVGFKHVLVVPEQEKPDSKFSTVEYPNPEDPAAFKLAIELAKENGAQIIIATDPDCDRVGVAARNKQGEYELLTGNQTGALLLDFVLRHISGSGRMPADPVVVKTIVTSRMGDKIAKEYGVDVADTLTGFKFIAEMVKGFEDRGEKSFVFGYEESYGYLAGDHARDKDAVVASMLAAEMAAYYYSRNKTLFEGLEELYKKYGYFSDGLENITLKGREGEEKIKDIMRSLREEPMESINGAKVIGTKDYAQGLDGLPKSNVLIFDLDDGSWFAARPSGTEPKIKFYFSAEGASREESESRLQKLSAAVMKHIISMI
ncbi:MAG: phospho-sugar mutase [Peptoclostridium sp.]|uniref:phospho-sugar mutase n=1 Tax=Peptoclostridium sp. TaxID=1904860 RepID=UPI00139E0D55|nr:phospho-sugar mutase [Peptoclostridium sp.]MZQ74598.1 phospho-sugar mutase [Peptoclostridium sp.]